MKRAVLLHGTDNSLEDNWYPWLLSQLELNKYNIFAPDLPNNHTPNRAVYNEFLLNSGWDFTDNLLIGHSSGATAIINMLLEDWSPKADTVILAGVFLNENIVKSASWYDPGQFDNLFPKCIDVNKLKQKCRKFVFIHGDNDPYCDFNDAKKLCDDLGGELIVVEGGQHLTKSSGFTKLPEILKFIENKK